MESGICKRVGFLRRCWVHAAAAVRVGGETAVVVINVEIFHMDWKLEHFSQISRHHSARESQACLATIIVMMTRMMNWLDEGKKEEETKAPQKGQN